VNLDALGPATSIPTSAFRLVHRHIGGVHEVVDHRPGVEVVSADARDADACRCAPGNRGDLLPQSFCDRLPFPGLRHLGDQEFLAADARDDRAPSIMITERYGSV
jgi:hypothetical protein